MHSGSNWNHRDPQKEDSHGILGVIGRNKAAAVAIGVGTVMLLDASSGIGMVGYVVGGAGALWMAKNMLFRSSPSKGREDKDTKAIKLRELDLKAEELELRRQELASKQQQARGRVPEPAERSPAPLGVVAADERRSNPAPHTNGHTLPRVTPQPALNIKPAKPLGQLRGAEAYRPKAVIGEDTP